MWKRSRSARSAARPRSAARHRAERHSQVRREHVLGERLLRVSERLLQSNNIDDALRAQGITRRRARFAHRRVGRRRRPHRARQALVLRGSAAPGAAARHAGVLSAERRGVLQPRPPDLQHAEDLVADDAITADGRVPYLHSPPRHGERQPTGRVGIAPWPDAAVARWQGRVAGHSRQLYGHQSHGRRHALDIGVPRLRLRQGVENRPRARYDHRYVGHRRRRPRRLQPSGARHRELA